MMQSKIWTSILQNLVTSPVEPDKDELCGHSLALPISLQEKLLPTFLSLSSLRQYCPPELESDLLFTEILFAYCFPRKCWRFMGVSINYTDGLLVEELVSTIFREDPTEDIDPPWSDIYAFCETALCSGPARTVPPFVRLAYLAQPSQYIFLPLQEFDYQHMAWTFDVFPLSRLA